MMISYSEPETERVSSEEGKSKRTKRKIRSVLTMLFCAVSSLCGAVECGSVQASRNDA